MKSFLEREAVYGSRGRSRRSLEGERWERNNLNKIVGVPWCENEGDPEMGGEKLKGEVVVMDEDYKGGGWRERSTFGCRKECTSRKKFGRLRIHRSMSQMHVVVQENGATGTHSGTWKESGSRVEGHSKRSGPQTNEGVLGQGSRETGEASEIDNFRR